MLPELQRSHLPKSMVKLDAGAKESITQVIDPRNNSAPNFALHWLRRLQSPQIRRLTSPYTMFTWRCHGDVGTQRNLRLFWSPIFGIRSWAHHFFARSIFFYLDPFISLDISQRISTPCTQSPVQITRWMQTNKASHWKENTQIFI